MNSSSKIAWSIFLSSVTSWLTSVRPIMIIQCRRRGTGTHRKSIGRRAERDGFSGPLAKIPRQCCTLEVKVCARSVSHIISRCRSLRGQRTHGLKLDWCYCCCLTSLTALCIGKHTQMSVINFIPLSMHNTVGFIFFAKFLTETVYFCYRILCSCKGSILPLW